jgi:sugar lactone lactonase YvrE
MRWGARTLGLALVTAVVTAAPAAAQRLPDGFFPESLARASDGTLFAGSVVVGTIVRIPPGGAAAEPFVAAGTGGLMSVEGLHVDDVNGLLYACSADLGVARTPKTETALLAFDLGSGLLRGRWPLPDGGFCNDIAPAADGRLYLSDTLKPRVLRFDPRAGLIETWAWHPLLGGAAFNGNGIIVDGAALYLTTFSDGRLLRVPIGADGRAGTPEQVILPRPLAGADALRRLGPDQLLLFENDISGGNGRVTRIDVDGDHARLTVLAEGLAEPTSGVVAGNQVIVLPSQFRKVFGAERGQAPGAFALARIDLPKGVAASIDLPDGFRYPNGIAVTADGTLFVGSVTAGTIVRQRRGGPWEPWFDGNADVFAGTALRLDAGRGLLWLASPDFLAEGRPARPHRVAAIDIATRRVVRSLAMPDRGFGNDIAIEPGGAMLMTDSYNGRLLRLPPGGDAFEIVIEDARLKGPDGTGIGAAGIALAADRRIILGNYGTGLLFVLENGMLRTFDLPRAIVNPDGLALTAAGDLILLEGDAAGGNGRVHRIRDPFAPGRRVLELIADGLESPVNLTVQLDGVVWVTEARIRHRLLPSANLPVPDRFRVLHVDIGEGATR